MPSRLAVYRRMPRWLSDIGRDTGLEAAVSTKCQRSARFRGAAVGNVERRSTLPSTRVRSPCTIRPERLSISDVVGKTVPRTFSDPPSPMKQSVAPVLGTSCRARIRIRDRLWEACESTSGGGNRPRRCDGGRIFGTSDPSRAQWVLRGSVGGVGSERVARIVVRWGSARPLPAALHQG